MTNALLLCGCKKDYDPPAQLGDAVICKLHGETIVAIVGVKLSCDSCTYVAYFSDLKRLTVCTKASSHMLRTGHTVSHHSMADPSATMCVHKPIIHPVFLLEDPPA